jgi:L-asparaginase II
VKTGAEGVYVAALPGSGLGIALKIDDGATRAAEVAMAAVLRQRLALGDDDPRASGLDALVRPTVTDRNGRVVGEVRPGDDLVALLAGRRRG